MNLQMDMDIDMGFDSMCPTPGFSPLDSPMLLDPMAEEKQRQKKLRRYAKIVERHAPNEVIVGEICDMRESYADNRVYVTVKASVSEDAFDGIRKTEGFIEAPDAVGVKLLSDDLNFGRTVVLDRKTGIILEALCDYNY